MRVFEDRESPFFDTAHELIEIDIGGAMGIKLHHLCAQSRKLALCSS